MKLVNQHQNQKKIKKNQKSSIERIYAYEISIQDKDLVNCLYGDLYEDLDFKIKFYKQSKNVIFEFYIITSLVIQKSLSQYHLY
jgi:hypothetical protein